VIERAKGSHRGENLDRISMLASQGQGYSRVQGTGEGALTLTLTLTLTLNLTLTLTLTLPISGRGRGGLGLGKDRGGLGNEALRNEEGEWCREWAMPLLGTGYSLSCRRMSHATSPRWPSCLVQGTACLDWKALLGRFLLV